MKILCLGDSPFLKTGFGVVNRVAVDHLRALGHELFVIGSLDGDEREEPGMTFIPSGDPMDRMGVRRVTAAVTAFKPDVVHMVGDLAMTSVWSASRGVTELSKFAYAPVEGAPTNWAWVEVLKAVDGLTMFTCSNYGVRELATRGIPAGMVYHGVSPEFMPLTPSDRLAWRQALGWTDKFMVMCVAQNVKRKQWPRLFEALRLVIKHHPNVYLYAHTVPYMDYWLGGHNLPVLAGEMGVWDHVVFPPRFTSIASAIPATGNNVEPGLTELYGMADAFVLPSQVEGFGLPLAEAMASGVPVIATGYAAGAEVVGSAGILIEPYDWEVSSSHALYGNLDPKELATQIVRLLKSQQLRQTLSQRGIERAKAFRWDDYRNALTEWSNANAKTAGSPQRHPEVSASDKPETSGSNA